MITFGRHIVALLFKEWFQTRHSLTKNILYVGTPFLAMLMLLLVQFGFKNEVVEAGPLYWNESHAIDMAGPHKIWHNLSNSFPYYMEHFGKGKENWIGVVTNGSDFSQTILEYLNSSKYQVISFSSVEELIKFAAMKTDESDSEKNKHIVTGVSFTSQGEGRKYSYMLYLDKNTVSDMSENFVDPLQDTPQYDEYTEIKASGIFFLKSIIDSMILRATTRVPTATVVYGFAPMMYKKSYHSIFGNLTEYIFGLVFIMGTLSPLVGLIGKFLDDKTSTMRDTLKVLGLKDSEYFLGYFIFYAIMQLVCVFGSTLIIFFKNYVDEYSSTNYFLFAMFTYCFALSIFPYAILISALFNSSLVGQIIGGLFFYLIAVVLYTFIQTYKSTLNMKLAASFFPQLAYFLGHEVFSRAILAKQGITFSNLCSAHSFKYMIPYAFVFFLIDFVIYLLVALYLDNVLPSGCKYRKPFYYFLMPSYWGCVRSKSQLKNGSEQLLEEQKEENFRDSSYENVSNSISAQVGLNKTLTIKNLCGIGTENISLESVSLDFFTGQIFSLLGKGGSAQSTLISAIVGMIPVTKGSIFMYGTDMINELSKVQEDIGYCGKEECLFDELTIREHLIVIAKFQGLSKYKIQEESERLLKEFKLLGKAETPVNNLTLGEKRKLSTCMALIANPRLLILEQPTRGMDTLMRKEVWEILKSYKRERIILITSDNMEEADSIGDRIGIMVQGKIACCGSAMFLKKHYGIGYHLHIAKSPDIDLTEDIEEFIQKHIPGSEIIMNVRDQLEFKLPFVAQDKYQSLFNEIENNLDILGIREYGVWITTLEDVFLKVGETDGDKNPHWSLSDPSCSIINNSEDSFNFHSEVELTLTGQLFPMLRKRFLEKIRNFAPLIFIVLFPIIFSIIGLMTYSASLYTESHTYSIKNDFPESTIYLNNETIMPNSISPYETMLNFQRRTEGPIKYFNTPINTNSWEDVEDLAYRVNIQISHSVTSYASYYIHQADIKNHNYSFLTLFNLKTVQSGLAYSSELTSHLFENYEGIELTTGFTQITVSEFLSDALENQDRVGSFTNAFSFAMSLIPGALILFLLREKKYGLKSHLTSSGLPIWIYWTAYYIVDTMSVYVPIFLLIIMYLIKGEVIQGAMVLLCIYPLSLVSFSYFSSTFFTSEALAFALNFFFHSFCGTFLPIMVIYPRLYVQWLGILLAHLLSVIPSFAAIWGIGIIANYKVIQAKLNESEQQRGVPLTILDIYDWNIGLQPVVSLAISIPFYFGLTVFLEYRKRRKNFENAKAVGLPEYHYKKLIDENVQAEEKRVIETHPEDCMCHFQSVSLAYQDDNDKVSDKLALHDVSFMTESGDVFCILGPGGAGKSTILRLLSGVIAPNKGEVFVNGKDVARRNTHAIGYCPEDSIVYEYLTVNEHFELYSGIKGIPVRMREKHIMDIMYTLKLTEVKQVKAKDLSAGNQRKLSVGIALIGNPPFIILDEPTLGIDPKIKHDLWALIVRISQRMKGSSVVVTTQQLDEAEALSTRLAILINGTFRCLGSPQGIKRKYAVGYYIEIKFDTPSQELAQQYIDTVGISYSLDYQIDMRSLQQMLQGINMIYFSNKIQKTGELSELYFRLTTELAISVFDVIKFILLDKWKDQTLYTITRECGETQVEFVAIGHYMYRVRLSNVSVGKMFSVVEDLKQRIPIYDYSVMQPTLGEVFHQFAEAGEEEIRKYEEEKMALQYGGDDADSEDLQEDDD